MSLVDSALQRFSPFGKNLVEANNLAALKDHKISSEMPKARQTCTRCSMRRQKCDRKDPCTRCIQNNEASSCSRKWQDGYDPRLHRTYPKAGSGQLPENSISSGSSIEGVIQNGGRSASLMQNGLSMRETFSSHPRFHNPTNVTTSQPLSDLTYANNAQQAASNNFQFSRADNEPSNPASPMDGFLEPYSNVSPNAQSSLHPNGSADNSTPVTGMTDANPFSREMEKQHLQNLIPSSRQVSQLIEYHETCLLWYHGCIHGPTFRMEVNKALQESDGLLLKNLDLQWSALLFAVMAASLTCTSEPVARSWGFPKAQKRRLSEKWYEAAILCLHLGDYTSKHNLFSVQAIQVLSMSAHTIGFSNRQFIIFGAAIRISQDLGLQRLALDPELDSLNAGDGGRSPSRRDILTRREVGRRIWTQMCTQDWFSIPSSEMYSINKQHFTTCRPRRIDDETMLAAGDRVPLVADSLN